MGHDGVAICRSDTQLNPMLLFGHRAPHHRHVEDQVHMPVPRSVPISDELGIEVQGIVRLMTWRVAEQIRHFGSAGGNCRDFGVALAFGAPQFFGARDQLNIAFVDAVESLADRVTLCRRANRRD